ncbi:hypothetical protein EMGBS5_08260 [Clavibacter sp.]|nr:hypothetical protein EMGBS5_08260 [Clavibacter sp.]
MRSVFGLSAYLITVIAIVAITIRSLELYRRIKAGQAIQLDQIKKLNVLF